ncbi:MAG: class I SAM-dependent methyltransferase [Acidobacteriota bacterium]
MPQTWNPAAYAQHGAFVPALAGGVLEWLAPQRGERILDLGCGDGQLTERLIASGAEVRGVDASPQMAAAARARGIDAIQASAEALPFADASFDAVFSNAVLHWVRDHDAMLAAVHRVLRPGGRFVAEFGGHGNIAAIRVAFAAALARHGFPGAEAHENYFPSAAEYACRLEVHGFRVGRIALIPRPTLLGAGGMAEWLRTFREGVLSKLPDALRDTVVRETVELLAPALRDELGNWTADYVRLRFAATR